MNANFICSEIDKIKEELIGLSLKIWSNPEAPYKEYKASSWAANFLQTEGFQIERNAGGIKTAIKATFGSGHPVIGFLGEYDALPGLAPSNNSFQKYGHGCGHNLICAANIGAVTALSRQMRKAHINGTIIFYGCPAEELLTGKAFMARAGLFEELDAAFAFHPMECNMTTYGNMVAANTAKFHFKGISAHAAADPFNGRSALDAVELMNVGANYLREHIKPDAKLHYTITKCGNTPNIVPDKASVWYFVRSTKREDVESVYDRLVKVAKGAALMTETELTVEYLGGCYNTLNNQVLEDVVHQAMLDIPQEPWSSDEISYAAQLNHEFESNKKLRLQQYGLPSDTELHTGVLPTLAYGDNSSSDVGDVAHIVPTAFFTTACCNIGAPGHHQQITECSGHSIGQKGMLYGAKILAKSALDIFTFPELLESAQKEFLRNTKGIPYKCPLPDNLEIPQ